MYKAKLVAVLSAAALLALGASMTSFAAGWEKDEAGIWHYYDSDDEMVTGEWKKDGGKWFYLDDDGDMLTDSWVDDEYYVGSDGAMYVNQWYKGFGDSDDQDSPEDDGEHWYYFESKGKKAEGKHKKINGKTYYFDEDGRMRWGWYEEDGYAYYLGSEDEGWRAEHQWLWLEKSGLSEEEEDGMNQPVLECSPDCDCDDEGWYYFQNDGKMYVDNKEGTKKNKGKKINGNYFIFNEHGQMLYEWVDYGKVKPGSNAQLDGILDTATEGYATVGQMLYFRENGSDSIDGSRPTGWFKIDGSEDVGSQDDTEWYYIKKGVAKAASNVVNGADDSQVTDDGDPVFRKREKIDGKWFVFNEKGEMQTGLQLVKGELYFYNNDGYQQAGKQAGVEEDDDELYSYYFTTKNAGNGKGVTGEKDGYLYWKGKRCEADDNYKLYTFDGKKFYLVNTKGKLQKNSKKKYDLDVPSEISVSAEDVTFKIDKSTYQVRAITSGHEFTLAEIAEVPHIAIKDQWLVPIAENNEKIDYTHDESDFADDFITADELGF